MTIPRRSPGQSVDDYLQELARRLDDELARRPERSTDGVLYLTTEVPVRLISPNGSIYELSVDDAGALVTTSVVL